MTANDYAWELTVHLRFVERNLSSENSVARIVRVLQQKQVLWVDGAATNAERWIDVPLEKE